MVQIQMSLQNTVSKATKPNFNLNPQPETFQDVLDDWNLVTATVSLLPFAQL